MKKQPTIAEMQKQVAELERSNSVNIQKIWDLNSEKAEALNKVTHLENRIDKLIDTNLNYSSK